MHQTIRLRTVLEHVAGLPSPGVPADARARLATLPVTRRERFGFRCASGSSPVLGQLPLITAEYLALTRGTSPAATVTALPGYLRDRWGLAHVWQLPMAITRRVAQRITDRRGESQPSR
jgi:hypothetical protein